MFLLILTNISSWVITSQETSRLDANTNDYNNKPYFLEIHKTTVKLNVKDDI